MNMMTGKRKKMDKVLKRAFILPVFFCLCIAFCDFSKKDTGTAASLSFRKIYDRSDTNSYSALDIRQTPDEGYIILGKVNATHPYLLKVDKQGNFSWDTNEVESFRKYTDPVPKLAILDNRYYFFCNDTSVENGVPILLTFSDGNKNELSTVERIVPSNPYPDDVDSFIVLPTQTTIKASDNYLLMASSEWGDGVTFIGKGNTNNNWDIDNVPYWNGQTCFEPYPAYDSKFHYTGELKNTGKYYFQTFPVYISESRYQDACVTIEMESPDGNSFFKFMPPHPLIAMEWDDWQWDIYYLRLSGAFINDNTVHFIVNQEIEIDKEIQDHTLDFNEGQVHPQHELLASKPVFTKAMTISGKEIVFFAAGTKSDRIVLYAYDLLENQLLKKRYFGAEWFYEACGLIETSGDSGLAILGITYAMDRIKRICLFKLSKAEVEEMCQQ